MQKIKQPLSFLWLGSMLFCSLAFAQAPEKHSFSVKQCAEYAKKNNATVKNALLAIAIQDQSNRQVTSAAYPQVTGNLSATHYHDIPVQSFPNFIAQATYGVLTHEGVRNGSGSPIVAPNGFGYIAASLGTQDNANGTLSVSQLLFDGQVFVGLQARATSMKLQQKNFDITEESIRENIYKIYYQLVLGKTQIALIDANIDRLEKLRHDAQVMYTNGFAEKLDVDKLTVQISNLQTEKTKAQNSIDIGYLGLKTLMGMPIKDELVLTDPLTDETIKAGGLVDSTGAVENRNDYQYLQMVKKLNEYNVKRYKLSYYPTVSLSGSYGKNKLTGTMDFFQKENWYVTSLYTLNVSIPMFDGFYKDAKIKQSKLELRQSENNLDNLKLNIENDIEKARINFKSAITTMDFQKKNMELSEKVFDQTKKKFQAGTGSNTEINAAETDLKTAQTNYISALYDAIIARIDYLKAIGKLE